MKNSMAELKKRWEDEYIIPFCQVDIKQEVFLSALWDWMQETAWHHATHLKLGYLDLAERGYFWVLSRLSIQMEHYPKWEEKIKVKTWLTGISRLFAFRHFSIANWKGDILGTAYSAWLVLDLKSRKPQRIEPVFKHILDLFDDLPSAEEPKKLTAPVRLKKETSYRVHYGDIDMHHHVNNTKYIEWILDRYPLEMHQEYHIHTFTINFLAESSCGDEIAIHTESLENTLPVFQHYLFREKDHRELCRAEVKWKRIDS